MNYSEFVEEVAKGTGQSQATVEAVIKDAVGLIGDVLKDGDDVSIPKLGKFRPVDQPQRQGRNPATGEGMTIAAKRVAKFSPAAFLKSWVNGEG